MKCKECDAENMEGAERCWDCGARLTAEKPAGPKNGWVMWVVLGAGCVLLIAAVLLSGSHGGGGSPFASSSSAAGGSAATSASVLVTSPTAASSATGSTTGTRAPKP